MWCIRDCVERFVSMDFVLSRRIFADWEQLVVLRSIMFLFYTRQHMGLHSM